MKKTEKTEAKKTEAKKTEAKKTEAKKGPGEVSSNRFRFDDPVFAILDREYAFKVYERATKEGEVNPYADYRDRPMSVIKGTVVDKSRTTLTIGSPVLGEYLMETDPSDVFPQTVEGKKEAFAAMREAEGAFREAIDREDYTRAIVESVVLGKSRVKVQKYLDSHKGVATIKRCASLLGTTATTADEVLTAYDAMRKDPKASKRADKRAARARETIATILSRHEDWGNEPA